MYQEGKKGKTLFGTWLATERFKLEKCQIATKAKALIMHSNCLSGIMKGYIASALDKAQSEGFAAEDISMINFDQRPNLPNERSSR
jgi:hypothetical protein